MHALVPPVAATRRLAARTPLLPSAQGRRPADGGRYRTQCACGGGCGRCQQAGAAAPAMARARDAADAGTGAVIGGVIGGVAGAIGGAFIGGPAGAVLGGLGGAAVGAAVGAGIGALIGAAAGGTKTVSVDAVKLRGSTRDPAADVSFANTVFAPANVHFSLAGNHTATAAESDGWLGNDTELDNNSPCGGATAEETAMWNGATTRFALSARVRAFYVGSLASGDRGYSVPGYCATGAAAGLNGLAGVSNSGRSRTLAHELGHILLNSDAHPDDTGNLMHPTNTATGNALTPEQQAAAYANA